MSTVQCCKCSRVLDAEDEVVYIDPVSTLASTNGSPYCSGCAPWQRTITCAKCKGLVEDAEDALYTNGNWYHHSCWYPKDTIAEACHIIHITVAHLYDLPWRNVHIEIAEAKRFLEEHKDV